VIFLAKHTSGTPLYTPSGWYTPGKSWYTLGCAIHPVDKHWCTLYKNASLRESGMDRFARADTQSIKQHVEVEQNALQWGNGGFCFYLWMQKWLRTFIGTVRLNIHK